MRAIELFETSYYGYKIMRYENSRAIAGADSRQSFIPKIGSIVSMTGNGIYMGTNKI